MLLTNDTNGNDTSIAVSEGMAENLLAPENALCMVEHGPVTEVAKTNL